MVRVKSSGHSPPERRRQGRGRHWRCGNRLQVAVLLRLGQEVVVPTGPRRSPEKARNVFLAGVRLGRLNAAFAVGEHGVTGHRIKKSAATRH